jgi:integrase
MKKSAINITKTSVDAARREAQARGKTLYRWDTETRGFGFYATRTGVCSYFIEYRLGGRGTPSKRVTLGQHGVFTPDQARKLAKEELGKVARGTDVSQVKKDERSKLTAASFQDLAERYFAVNGKLEKTGEWKSRHWRETHGQIHQLAFPVFGDKTLASITRAQIAALIDETKVRSHSTARNLFGALRPIFLWAAEGGAIEQSPMTGLRGPKPVKSRERVLSDDEIKALWQAAGAESWPFENVFKMWLLTAQRRNEVSGMRWREIDLDAGTWTIAKERSKNGKAHRVDLSPESVRMLVKTTDDLVFSTTGTTPVSGFSKVKLRVDARMKELLGDKFEPWRIHDLRRTAASGMAALGFQPHVIERVLNHVSGVQGGLVGVYQRHEYRDERKRALLAWGAHVERLTGREAAPSNVVAMRKAV